MTGWVAVLLLVLTGGCRGSAGPQPEHVEWTPTTEREHKWDRLNVRNDWTSRADRIIANTLQNRSRYEKVERMRRNGVPWFIVAGLHERESSQRFTRHLHEGSPLTRRTRYIPRGRPVRGSPPFTWEESAEDALYLLKDLENKCPNWYTDIDRAIDLIERYNGLGYRRYHPEVGWSPYLASGSQLYTRGKYVADGRFSRTAVDKQIGVLTLMRRMIDRGIIAWPGKPP